MTETIQANQLISTNNKPPPPPPGQQQPGNQQLNAQLIPQIPQFYMYGESNIKNQRLTGTQTTSLVS